MELLAQCSHALYNEELLFAKKRERELERELNNFKSQYCVPRIKYKNKEEWETAVELLSKEMSDFILMENYNLFGGGSGLVIFIRDICKLYQAQLEILLKNKHTEWCNLKSKELYNILQLSFCGLVQVGQELGTPQQYRLFIKGVVKSYTKSYQTYKYGYEHGHIDHIPYYDCVKCNKRIHGEYKYHGMYKHLFIQHCVPCISETLKKVKCIQRLWRNYHKCKVLNIKPIR